MSKQFLSSYAGDTESGKTVFTSTGSIDKKFPNAKTATASFKKRSFWGYASFKSNYIIYTEDWGQVESCLKPVLPMLARLLPPYRTHALLMIAYLPAAIQLYAHKKNKNESDELLKDALLSCRAKIENYAKTLPGMYRCCCQAFVAQISLLVKDRALKDEMQRMEDALAYIIELDCMPIDLLILKECIGTWKCDLKMLSEVENGYEKLKFRFFLPQLKNKMKQMKSGELVPVDLAFVPASTNENIDDPLMVLEKAILDAKAKVLASKDDMETMKAARAELKKLTKEKKALVSKMEAEENAIDIDAKISELQDQIDDANKRAMAAMEEDDEDAEEAAYEEADKLMGELEKLKQMMSGPKKKMVEAQQTDKALN